MIAHTPRSLDPAIASAWLVSEPMMVRGLSRPVCLKVGNDRAINRQREWLTSQRSSSFMPKSPQNSAQSKAKELDLTLADETAEPAKTRRDELLKYLPAREQPHRTHPRLEQFRK